MIWLVTVVSMGKALYKPKVYRKSVLYRALSNLLVRKQNKGKENKTRQNKTGFQDLKLSGSLREVQGEGSTAWSHPLNSSHHSQRLYLAYGFWTLAQGLVLIFAPFLHML